MSFFHPAFHILKLKNLSSQNHDPNECYFSIDNASLTKASRETGIVIRNWRSFDEERIDQRRLKLHTLYNNGNNVSKLIELIS